MKYRVEISATKTAGVAGEVEVEADNIEDAKRIALAKAENEYDSIAWETWDGGVEFDGFEALLALPMKKKEMKK